MFNKANILKTEFIRGIAIFFLLLTALSACASPEPQSVLEEAPPRRGSAEILVEVRDITADIMGVPFADVTAASNFKDDLGADDGKMAELAAEFETVFLVELSDVDVNGLTTVRSAVDLIDSKQ